MSLSFKIFFPIFWYIYWELLFAIIVGSGSGIAKTKLLTKQLAIKQSGNMVFTILMVDILCFKKKQSRGISSFDWTRICCKKSIIYLHPTIS